MSRRKKKPAPAVLPGVGDLFPYGGRPVPVMTILEGQNWLREQAAEKGAKCPCCRQYVKLYGRKLNTTMARGLLWLCQKSGPDGSWVDVPKFGPRWLVTKGGTLATLAHWDLIESQENEDKKKRTSGLWRPTKEGWDFAHGKRVAPTHVFLYNNRPIAFSNTFMGIEGALGDGFDYEELMEPIRSMSGTQKGQTSMAI